MKKLALWSLVLAVAILAVGTAAQAAVVDIVLSFDKTTGIAIGEEVAWSITVKVTGNTYSATIGGTGHTYNAGFQSMAVGVSSTSLVGAFPTPDEMYYGGAYNIGTAPDAWPDPELGLGKNVIAGPNGGFTDQLLAGPLKSGAYSSGNFTSGQADLKPTYKIGVAEVLYASGTWKATAAGSTNLMPYMTSPSGRSDIYSMLMYTVSSTGAVSQRNILTGNTTDIVHFTGVTLAVGGSNHAPTITSVSPNPVLETSWDKSSGGIGWNDPGHFVDITAVGADQDPGDTLTYDWKLTGGGKTDLMLATGAGAMLHLTLQDLINKGFALPAYPGAVWSLGVRANDGTDYSAWTPVAVFVPEPATIGLLALGVVGLLKRRRRA